MAGIQPVAVYALKVPAGDVIVPAVADFAAMFRVSMAAIDPSAEPELIDGEENKRPRATLKILRMPFDDDSDFDSESGSEEDDETSSDDDDEMNGGPSDLSKSKKDKSDDESLNSDESEDDEEAAKAALLRVMKGKGKAGEEDDDLLMGLDFDDKDQDGLEFEEVVVCTLDPENHYQQTLDLVVGENEKVYFKVSGTYEVHLTGNYVIPVDDGQAQIADDEDYDLDPEEDELEMGLLEDMDDDESDDLDDLDDPRITEIESEDEVPVLAAAPEKGKNKRPAEDSDDEVDLDTIMAKSIKADEPKTNGVDKPLSKSQKKKLKKLKKNDGEAAAVDGKDAKKEVNGEKKVQFAEKLEQGPTPSAKPLKQGSKKDAKSASKETTGEVKVVQGVTIDERKVGTGPQAKKGSRVELRYIGKLENGKVFDANKKGPAFSFKIGGGEVIKGWDIGIAGMAAGGERRLTIPAHLGYGSKGGPPAIPPNSKLTFDIKLLGLK